MKPFLSFLRKQESIVNDVLIVRSVICLGVYLIPAFAGMTVGKSTL